MKKLLFICMILMSFLIACGGSKNEKKNENPDSEDTNDSDIDTVEISDGDTTPDNPDTTDDVDNPGNTQPDKDPEDPPSGGGSCNAKESYGSTNFIRGKDDFFDNCISRSENSSHCYSEKSYGGTGVAGLFGKLQKVPIIFKKECKQNDEPIQCPDFIPDSITLSQLAGCTIYYVSGNLDCLADCPKFYFTTDNEIFKIVSFQHDYHGAKLFYTNAEIDSINEEGTLGFSMSHYDRKSENYALFYNYENNTIISLPYEIKPKCDDGEGRKYSVGNKISYECNEIECYECLQDSCEEYFGEAVWVILGSKECSACNPGEKKNWSCETSNETIEIDWCECIEDEEYGSKWNCVERADLNCSED